jgi:5'(3')-deoxyribonucleotidase
MEQSQNPTIVRKKVGVDIDGTLALFHDAFILEYNAIHGTHYTLEDFSSYGKWDIPIPYPEFMRMHDEMWTERWRDIKPSITQSTLARLVAVHEVDILTHRPKRHEPYVRKWLDLYFPDVLPQLRIRITDTTEEKAFHNHDVLIDDASSLADALIKRGESKPLLVLVEQPWNRKENYEQHRDIIKRVKTLEEGIALLTTR